MKSKITLAATLFLVLSIVLGACAPAEEATAVPETEAPPEVQTEEPMVETEEPMEEMEPCVIKIGYFGPLTGNAADLGNETANAAQLAIDQANAAGGVTLDDGRTCTVELTRVDSEGDPEKGLAAVERLINEDTVDIIVGCVYSTVGLAVLDTINRSGVPFINTVCASIQIPRTIASENYSNIYSVSPTTDLRGTRAAELIHQMLKATKVALVLESGDAGHDDGAAQKAYYAESAPEIEVVAEEYFDPTTTDFSAVMAKLRATEPDVVYSMFLGVATIAFAEQYCEQGIPAQPVSGFVPGSFTSDLGDCADGWVINEVWTPRSAVSELTLPFVEAFEAAYDKTPGYWSSQEYDGVLIAIEAYRQAGTTDKSVIAETLQSIRIMGVRGEQYFDPIEKGHTVPASLVFSEIIDGVTLAIWPASAAETDYVPYSEFLP